MEANKDHAHLTRQTPTPAPADQPAQLTRWMTMLLDDMATVPGTRIRVGLDPVLSLIPGVGTTTGVVLGGAIMMDALRLRMPIPVLARMGANYLLDWLIGLVPVLGAVGDVAFRANRRNLCLLNRTIHDREQVRRASVRYWLAAAGIIVGGLILVVVSTLWLIGWAWGHLAAA